MPARVRIPIALAFVGVSIVMTSHARADNDDDRAAARAAATSGIEAYEAGRFQEALDLCTRAEAIVHAPPHLLYIARAQVKLRQLVKAHETYIKIIREQLAADAPRAFQEAQAHATEEEAALAPRVPTLKINVDGAAPEVVVMLDGTPVPQALIGLQRPIDPGSHKIEAKAQGANADPMMVTIGESESREVTLHITPGAMPSANAPTATPDAPTASSSSSSSSLKIGGWVGIGVGAVGAIAGTIFLLKNHSDRSDADALCTNGQCPASKRDQIDSLDSSASSAATMAWIGYGVGAVGLGVGAVLLYLSGTSESEKPATSARVIPWVGPRSAGATVRF